MTHKCHGNAIVSARLVDSSSSYTCKLHNMVHYLHAPGHVSGAFAPLHCALLRPLACCPIFQQPPSQAAHGDNFAVACVGSTCECLSLVLDCMLSYLLRAIQLSRSCILVSAVGFFLKSEWLKLHEQVPCVTRPNKVCTQREHAKTLSHVFFGQAIKLLCVCLLHPSLSSTRGLRALRCTIVRH